MNISFIERPDMKWPTLVRVAVGLVLFYSGALKLQGLDRFAGTLETMQLPLIGSNEWLLLRLAESVPWFEIGLGVVLIIGFLKQGALRVAGGLFVSFTLILIWLLLTGFEGECGCLGPLLSFELGWVHVGIDGLIAAVCLAAASASSLSQEVEYETG